MGAYCSGLLWYLGIQGFEGGDELLFAIAGPVQELRSGIFFAPEFVETVRDLAVRGAAFFQLLAYLA